MAEPQGPQDLMNLYMKAGPWVFQTIYVAAELDLVNQLGDGPTSISVLAQRTNTNERALYRFCRALSTLGLLVEHEGHAFTATPMGDALRLEPVRGGITVFNGDAFRAWADVLHTVRTGEPAFDHAFGTSFYDHLAKNPEAAAAFNASLGAVAIPPPVLDWIGQRAPELAVDVGGGSGLLLAQVLQRTPAARGVLLDIPSAVRDAPALLEAHGLAERVEVVAESFFDAMPEGADTYLLARVLYNWGDEDALRLLKSIRGALAPGGRLVMVEPVLQPSGAFDLSLLIDLHMLILLGGQFRTLDELTDLFACAELRIDRMMRLGGDDQPPVALELVAA